MKCNREGCDLDLEVRVLTEDNLDKDNCRVLIRCNMCCINERLSIEEFFQLLLNVNDKRLPDYYF